MHKLQTQQYGNITKDISIIETKISQLSAQITQMETRFGKMMEHDFENRDRRIDEINAELSRLREKIINIAREDRYAFMKKQYKLYLVESFVCLFAIFCQNRRLHPESPETAAQGRGQRSTAREPVRPRAEAVAIDLDRRVVSDHCYRVFTEVEDVSAA